MTAKEIVHHVVLKDTSLTVKGTYYLMGRIASIITIYKKDGSKNIHPRLNITIMDITLTKEGFWNEMEQKYPAAMQEFKTWINQYKQRVSWDTLFGDIQKPDGSVVQPKYHDLPTAMQIGIFIEYTMQHQGNKSGLSMTDYTETIQSFLNYNQLCKSK